MAESINQEAERLVYGPREADYSHPIVDFTTTGRIWAAILGLEEITAEQVALMMAGLKLSRLTRNPSHRDSMVDVCGYMATYERIRQRRDEEEPSEMEKRSWGEKFETDVEQLKKDLESEQKVSTPTDSFKHKPCPFCETEGYETAGPGPNCSPTPPP